MQVREIRTDFLHVSLRREVEPVSLLLEVLGSFFELLLLEQVVEPCTTLSSLDPEVPLKIVLAFLVSQLSHPVHDDDELIADQWDGLSHSLLRFCLNLSIC